MNIVCSHAIRMVFIFVISIAINDHTSCQEKENKSDTGSKQKTASDKSSLGYTPPWPGKHRAPKWVRHPKHYYDKSMQQIDFEDFKGGARAGRPLIEKAYRKRGCLFACESKNGEVRLDSYDVRGRSPGYSGTCSDIAAYPDSPRYKGTLRVTFCDPANPDIPATTNRVGMFLQMIVPPRSIVLEAYNEDDEIVGFSEAVSSTSFVGMETRQPIAYVRVRTNYDLVMDVDMQPDVDFAFDDVTFSKLKRSATGSLSGTWRIGMRDGSEHLAKKVKVEGTALLLEDFKTISGKKIGKALSAVDLNNIAVIASPTKGRKTRKIDASAFVRLKDGSVVAIKKIGSGSVDFPEVKITRETIVGICGQKQSWRYATHEDYNSGKSVAVFPTYRLRIDSIDLATEKISWSKDVAKKFNQTVTEFKEVKDVDFGNEFEIEQSPTIWLKSPQPRAAKTGILRTTDGQRFVLGGTSGFKLVSVKADGVTIKNAKTTVRFSFDQIKSLIKPTSAK